MKNSMKKITAMLICLMMLMSVPFTAFAASNEVSRVAVTINGDSDTSRGISWYTDGKCDSIVQIAKADDGLESAKTYKGSCTKAMEKYVHKVTVDSLEPDTKYVYKVGDGESWSENGYFTTSSKESDTADFIVIADVQASKEENFQKAAVVMKKATETMPEHDFIVNLGDFVNDCTNEEWDSYFRNFAFANMNTTLIPIAGNHEGNLQWGKFNNMFNIGAAKGSITTTGCYYSFDWGDAHFSVLNSNDMYPMSQQQLNWLKNDMRASDAQWKIILMHRSAYSAGKNINKPDTVVMREVLLPIFDELDIDVVFAGHDHMYFRTKQVEGDKVQLCESVTEVYNGEATEFMLNPAGTVHILPSTAGTKRYSVNEDAIPPILDCGDVVRNTKSGGTFATVSMDSEHFVYKAYIVDDETHEKELIDSYAIKKTEKSESKDYITLPTDHILTLPGNVLNFVYQIVKMLLNYLFVLLPSVIF